MYDSESMPFEQMCHESTWIGTNMGGIEPEVLAENEQVVGIGCDDDERRIGDQNAMQMVEESFCLRDRKMLDDMTAEGSAKGRSGGVHEGEEIGALHVQTTGAALLQGLSIMIDTEGRNPGFPQQIQKHSRATPEIEYSVILGEQRHILALIGSGEPIGRGKITGSHRNHGNSFRVMTTRVMSSD